MTAVRRRPAANADKTQTTTLREAEDRLEGAKRAAVRADVDRSTFAAENVDGLIAERRPDASVAVEEVGGRGSAAV